jgi:hypothetical protein
VSRDWVTTVLAWVILWSVIAVLLLGVSGLFHAIGFELSDLKPHRTCEVDSADGFCYPTEYP